MKEREKYKVVFLPREVWHHLSFSGGWLAARRKNVSLPPNVKLQSRWIMDSVGRG
jgi:hypothetical protein